MEIIAVIGRILFSLLFLGSAMGHLTKTDGMAGYAESKGVPSARPMVLLTGIMLLLGGLSVLLGVWPDLGALLLVAFLIPTAFIMHPFWKEDDPSAAMGEQTHFLKDLSLGGAALMLFAVFASDAATDLMITGPLFSLS